ncbi:MAG: hypothetical protein IJG45_03785 [Oscillospiraceae bacterium]|nr:hypothetical protein [Oscillospiraceae bacterium]
MGKEKKIFISLLSLTLVLAILVTGFGWPGFFRSASSRSGSSSDFTVEGNSKAIHLQPLDYLTIDAPENAFAQDTEVRFTEITDDSALDELESTLRTDVEAHNDYVLAAYEIDMGLEPDELMPGSYTVAIDLEKAGIPEELWQSVTAYRVDADGYWSEYAVSFDGNSMIVESQQNSALVISAFVGYVIIDELVPTISAMDLSLKRFFTPEDSIYVYENNDWRTGKRIFKLKFTYNDTVAELMKRKDLLRVLVNDDKRLIIADAREALGRELGIQPNEVTGPQLRVYRERIKDEICRKNAEYVALEAQINQYEETQKLSNLEMIGRVAKNLRTAYQYLKEQVKVNMPKYVMDVRLSYVVGGEGATGVTVNHILLKNSYLMINTSYLLTQGSEKWYDKMLVTATHEVFHACQRTYCSRLYNIKFEEATAQMIEDDCNEYYLKNGITTHDGRGENAGKLEVYAIPIDKFSVTYDGETIKYKGDDKSDAGYPLCHFIRYLRDKLAPEMTYAQMCQVYKKFWTTPTVTELLKELFGLNDEGLTLQFQMFAHDKQAMFYEKAESASENMDHTKRWAFPFSMKFSDDTDPTPRLRVEVKDYAYTLRTRYLLPVLPTGYDGDIALLLVPDPGFEEALPDLRLVPAGPNQANAKRSRNGLFFPPQPVWDPFYVIEADGGTSDTGRSAYYSVWTLTAPQMDPPKTEGGELIFTLPELSGAAGAGQGLIDGYRITVTCSDGTVTEKYYPISDAATEQSLYLNDLKASSSKAEDVTFSLTVCEYIDEGGGSYTFCPESGAISGKSGGTFEDTLSWGNTTSSVRIEGAEITDVEDARESSIGGLVKQVNGTVSRSGTLTLSVQANVDLSGFDSLGAYLYYYDAAGNMIRSEMITALENGRLSVMTKEGNDPNMTETMPGKGANRIDWEVDLSRYPNVTQVRIHFLSWGEDAIDYWAYLTVKD